MAEKKKYFRIVHNRWFHLSKYHSKKLIANK